MTRTGWRRKKGIDRRLGCRRLERWTPKAAHKFCTTRLNDIEMLLQEIAVCYDEVDQAVINECDDIRDSLANVKRAVDEALSEGRDLGW